MFFLYFFFNDTATTELYTLSLHDALPISRDLPEGEPVAGDQEVGEDDRVDRVEVQEERRVRGAPPEPLRGPRSEEHTSELQSHHDLVCRLLLEKKKRKCTQNEVKSTYAHQ